MASEQHLNLHFESKALEPDTFKVVRFEGVEEISRCYRFEIELVSDHADIDLAAVLGQPAHLALQRGDDGEPRKLHGILAEFEQGPEVAYGHYSYRAVLVPRLWLLSLSRQNQIYQAKSVIEIVEEELKGAAGKGPAEMAAIGLTSDDFEFRLSGSYVNREYVVQYQETDLDFICRWLEHEGVFFYFEHDDDKEKIVFCDDNVHLPKIDDAGRIAYNLPSGTSSALQESVQALTCRQAQTTAKMILKDYNYRTPTTPLQGEAEIDDAGHGLISEYGNHFKTPEEGQGLARIRAQEIHCRKMEYRGESDALGFAAGRPFALEDHFRHDFDQEYANIRVHHVGSQSFAEATGLAEVDGQATSYRNDFTAIPLSVPFRPARRTPKPKLHGVMNGQVDAEGAGSRAEIDGEGRYKLVMPFDLSGQAEGKATRWVRMAQPYGGGQQGMHFPLLKGTEVIWTCIDGDPDRPIITGTVPNPLNKSVINAESNTKNRIQTASGILMEFQDGAGPAGGNAAASAGGALAGQQQRQRAIPVTGQTAGTAGDRSSAAPAAAVAHSPGAATDQPEQTTRSAQPLTRQQQQSADFVDQEQIDHDKDAKTPEVKWFRFNVPDYDGNSKTSYLRHGKFPADANANLIEGKVLGAKPDIDLKLNKSGKKPDPLAHHLDGVFDYTDGNRTEITSFNSEAVIGGKSRISIGDKEDTTPYVDYKRKVGSAAIGGAPIWRHTKVTHGSSDTWQWGDSERGFAGFKFNGTLGLATSALFGGSLRVGASANIDIGYAYNVDMKFGPNVDFTANGQNTLLAEDHDVIGDKTISLRIKPASEAAGEKTWLGLAKRTGTLLSVASGGALVGGGGGALFSYLHQGGGGSDDGASTWGSSIGFTAATAAWAAGLGLGIHKNRTTDHFEAMSPARIDMKKKDVLNGQMQDEIKLIVGPAGGMETSISLKPGSIELKAGLAKIKLDGKTGKVQITGNDVRAAGSMSTTLGSSKAAALIYGMSITNR